jgi:outer membrane beta-barrel protein
MIKNILSLYILLLLAAPNGWADDVDKIETLFDESESRDARRSEQEIKDLEVRPEIKQAPITKLENLNSLKPFEDVAVIQKRYLPRTKRFEANLNAASNINDSFFSAYGGGLGLTYNFTEKFGFEGVFKYFSASNSKASNQLLEKGIVTNGMVVTEMYYGVDFRWTPIYGKFSYFDRKIIPFDHYFTIGVGRTSLKAGSSTSNSTVKVEALDDPITLKIGTGEVFALTKYMAFRWDVSWHFMQPNVRTTTNNVANDSKDLQNNLFINFGLSFFFPEAKYR